MGVPADHCRQGGGSSEGIIPGQRIRTRGTQLVLNAVRELFDYRVGEDFAGDALNLSFGIGGRQAICQRKGEILALADCFNLRESDLAEGIVYGLTLRIEDRGLQRNVDMSLHHP